MKLTKTNRNFVVNCRGNIILSGGDTGRYEFNTSDFESPTGLRPRVIFDGGTGLEEILASTATTGSAGGLNEIMTGLNDAKTQINLHMGRGVGVGHAGGPDAANVITAPNATDFDSARVLALEIQTNYAAHLADTTVHGPGTADVVNVLTTDPGYDLKSLTEAFNDIKAMSNAHVVDVTGAPALHDAVGADLITAANATKATAIAGTSADVAAAGWTINQWRGYYCEWLSGPLAGETYLIRGNDGSVDGVNDRLLFNGEWTLDPGTGSNFRIVRQETVIDGGSPVSFAVFGPTVRGAARVQMQNFRTTNGTILTSVNEGGQAVSEAIWSHVIMECQPYQVFPLLVFPQTGSLLWSGTLLLDCSTPDCDPVVGADRLGLSQNADTFVPSSLNQTAIDIYDSVVPFIIFSDCRLTDIQDSAFALAEARGCTGPRPTHTGFGRCRFGDPNVLSPFPALRLESCNTWLAGGIYENADHGIEALKGSQVTILGGMGSNTKSGAYVHGGSSLDLYRSFGTSGIPEIDGNSGTVELTIDGVNPKSTWGAIDGAPVSDPECLAGKYFDDNAPPWWTNF
jgi:hypothetical protein